MEAQQFFGTSGFAKALNAKGIRANGASICRAIKKGEIDAFRIGEKWCIEVYELERLINTAQFLGNTRLGNIKLN